jgi:outer membrane protein insertion porin family
MKFFWRAAALAAALFITPALAGRAAAQQPITQRVAVGTVEVVGFDRVSLDQAMAHIGIRAGDSIGPVEIDRAMRRLFATGQYADVQVFTLSNPDDPDAPATVRFELVEQPLVARIEFTGLQNVRGTLVRDTVGLRAGQPYQPDRAVRAEAMTRQLLAEKGIQTRRIAHRLEPVPERPGERVLIIDVEEGHRVAITDVEFVGNERFSNDRLRRVMGTRSEGFLWFRTGTYTEEQLRDDLRRRLPAFYAGEGFIDFTVLGDSIVVDDETGKARLLVTVSEGPQYRIASFDVRGSSRFHSDDLRRYFEQRRSGGVLSGLGIGGGRDIGTRAGEVFDATAFSEATTDVQRLYTNQGYLYAQITPVIERVAADTSGQPQVRIGWEIREGQPASIRRVAIRGNTFTHESVIRSQIMVLPGDIYSEDLLIQSYRRIGALGFFETPMPAPDIQETGTGDVDVTFEVQERQTGSVNFGASLGGALGLMGFLGYDQPNLFGKAKSGHLRWEFGKYSNNFEASYSDPAIQDSRVSGSVSVFSSTDRFFTFSEGRRRRTGAGIRAGLPLPRDPFSRFTMGYSLSRTEYENFDDDPSSIFSLPPGVQSTVTLGVQRMALDHPMFPTVGSRHELEASLSGGPLGGDGNFQKYTASGAWYVPIGSVGGTQPGTRPLRMTLGMSAEAGALFGDASGFPFERFWMGGVQFGRPLRGYDETTITPRGYIPKNASGVGLQERFGDAYVRLSAEYAVRFTDNISISAFYDAGNVWRRPSEADPTRLLRGAGVGLMLITPFGPLGLDYAYGFDKDKPGWQMHFKFGQGF